MFRTMKEFSMACRTRKSSVRLDIYTCIYRHTHTTKSINKYRQNLLHAQLKLYRQKGHTQTHRLIIYPLLLIGMNY